MKKILSLMLGSLLIFSISCGDGGSEDGGNEDVESNDQNNEDSTDYSDMTKVSLDTFGLDMHIMLPQYDGPMNSILPHRMEELEEGARWRITIGQEEKEKFCIFVEDAYGDMMEAKDEGREADFVQDKKDELAGFSFMTINYEIDEPDAILYETIYDGGTVPNHYHVLGVVRNGEDIYRVYSDPSINRFNKQRAENMLKAIKSMNKPAA